MHLNRGFLRYCVPYAVALALVAVAAVLRIWPLKALGSNLAWLTFYPASILAALYGGMVVGLFATMLAAVTVVYLWRLVFADPLIVGLADRLSVLAFLVFGSFISVASGALRAAFTRAEGYRTFVRLLDQGFCVVEMMFDEDEKPIDYRFIDTNPAFVAQTGLLQWKEKTMREMVPDHDAHWFEIYGRVARTGEEVRFEHAAVAMERYYEVFAFRVGDAGSNKVGIFFKDISARKQVEAELVKMARHDALTGLPNRAMLYDYLGKALARSDRAHQKLALLFLDLDGFKAVNDALGHHSGDILLRLVAQRLLLCMREGDLVCRLGGDEFTIVLEDCQPGTLAMLFDKIIRVIEAPYDLDGAEAQISTSIGIAIYPDDTKEMDELIQLADASMYALKKERKRAVQRG